MLHKISIMIELFCLYCCFLVSHLQTAFKNNIHFEIYYYAKMYIPTACLYKSNSQPQSTGSVISFNLFLFHWVLNVRLHTCKIMLTSFIYLLLSLEIPKNFQQDVKDTKHTLKHNYGYSKVLNFH